MPLNMAMEKRDTWVVGYESNGDGAIGHHEDSVATHRRAGRDVDGEVGATGVAAYDLEVMAVEMERMSEGIVIA